MTLLLAPNGDILGPSNFTARVTLTDLYVEKVFQLPEPAGAYGQSGPNLEVKRTVLEVGQVKHHDGKIEIGLKFATDDDVALWRAWSASRFALRP